MVGKRARSPDTSPWEPHVGKRVTLRTKTERRACEGLVAEFQPGGSDEQATVTVIHTDGLLRRWKATEVELMHVLSDKPFSKSEVEARRSGRPGWGGTQKGQQAIQDGQLQGQRVHVWNEDTMQWESGDVIDAAEGERFRVAMEEGTVELDLANLVWKVEGESAADVLKSEKELLVLEDPSVPVIVTQQPSAKRMFVYLQTKNCSQGEEPKVFATSEVIHVQDSTTDGQQSRDVVVVLQKHQQCDTSEIVEAVLDKENWLRVAFRNRT